MKEGDMDQDQRLWQKRLHCQSKSAFNIFEDTQIDKIEVKTRSIARRQFSLLLVYYLITKLFCLLPHFKHINIDGTTGNIQIQCHNKLPPELSIKLA